MKPTYFGLFSGIMGIELAFQRAGFEISGAVEIDEYCTEVNKKNFPEVPKYKDVRKITTRHGKGWKRYQHITAAPDVLGGGFPCQDISIAGKGAGIRGTRSGLFFEFARLIGEIRPPYVFMENVPAITHRGGLIVAGELTQMGYSPQWGTLRASDFGFPQVRERWFCVAIRDDMGNASSFRYQHSTGEECHTSQFGTLGTGQWAGESGQVITTNTILVNANRTGSMGQQGCLPQRWETYQGNENGECVRSETVRPGELVNPECEGLEGQDGREPQSCNVARSTGQQPNESRLGRVFDGLSSRLDGHQQVARPNEIQYDWEPPRTLDEKTPYWNQRIKALGNAVVPQVIEPIAKRLYQIITEANPCPTNTKA